VAARQPYRPFGDDAWRAIRRVLHTMEHGGVHAGKAMLAFGRHVFRPHPDFESVVVPNVVLEPQWMENSMALGLKGRL